MSGFTDKENSKASQALGMEWGGEQTLCKVQGEREPWDSRVEAER